MYEGVGKAKTSDRLSSQLTDDGADDAGDNSWLLWNAVMLAAAVDWHRSAQVNRSAPSLDCSHKNDRVRTKAKLALAAPGDRPYVKAYVLLRPGPQYCVYTLK